jgi:Flp pilus assembly protein TadG
MSINSKQSIATVITPEASKELATAVLSPKGPVSFRLSQFRDDQSGSTAMIFGLTLLPVVFFVGIAVDFSRGLTLRAQSQVALDAAALAAGRAYQTAAANASAADAGNCNGSTGKSLVACDAANKYFNAMKPTQSVLASLAFTPPSGAKTEFTVKATTWLKTPFLNAVAAFKQKPAEAGAPPGCTTNGWQCMKLTSTAAALVAAGGSNTTISLETALMIDITGSMGPDFGDGNKLLDAKVAAKDLIEILVWDNQTTVTSKVSLVPFSKSVNAGTYAATVTGRSATSGSNKLRPCVIERLGTNAATDEAPSASNGWIGAYAGNNAPSSYSYNDQIASDNNNSSNYDTAGTCDPGTWDGAQGWGGNPQNNAAIVPLTTNKTTLKNTVDALVASGGTAGHLGTAWAWYTLSPKWNSIWPTASQPSAYNAANVNKIAVLMTDGDYNTDYSSGNSEDKAGALCTAMKAKSITVYTVGFQVSNDAKTFLKSCATTNGHYYDATTGESLKQAFRDIALKISSLRISK